MSLVEISIAVSDEPIPGNVSAFLAEAERRIEEFQKDSPVPGFVASDFAGAYRVLRAVADARLAPGRLFCEWGCGFGVVAGLAAMLGFNAVGIEIDDALVDEAERLASDFNVPVEFLRGSFLPADYKVDTTANDGFAWLATDERHPRDDADPGPDDFDIIYVYPWPAEEDIGAAIFSRFARAGAILVTFHANDGFRVRRKKGRKGRPTPGGLG